MPPVLPVLPVLPVPPVLPMAPVLPAAGEGLTLLLSMQRKAKDSCIDKVR